MSFDIISYVDEVEARLEKLPVAKRVAFSLWCIQPLLDEFSGYLSLQVGPDNISLLQNAINQTWKCIITGTIDQSPIIQRASALAKSIELPEDAEPDEELLNFGAIELVVNLERVFYVVETGASMHAAGTVQGVIVRIDYELGMIEEAYDPLADSRVLDEVDRQKHMLQHLETELQLSDEDRRRFRR
jgi:hypothetical protein